MIFYHSLTHLQICQPRHPLVLECLNLDLEDLSVALVMAYFHLQITLGKSRKCNICTWVGRA